MFARLLPYFHVVLAAFGATLTWLWIIRSVLGRDGALGAVSTLIAIAVIAALVDVAPEARAWWRGRAPAKASNRQWPPLSGDQVLDVVSRSRRLGAEAARPSEVGLQDAR